MKKYLLVFLLLSGCAVSAVDEPKCVVYDGYNQIWYKKVVVLKSGNLRARKFSGETVVITNYSDFKCYD